MPNQKIAVLHITFNMDFGGTEQVIRQLVQHATRDRFAHAILCIDGWIGGIGEQLRVDDVSIFCHERRRGFDWQLVKHIRKLVREHEFDIVHCHQYTPYVYGALGAIRTKAQVVFTEHGRFYPDRSSWKRRFANQALLLITRRIVAISNATRRALSQYEWIPRRRVQVIYNGIADPSRNKCHAAQLKRQLGIPLDHLVVGTVSRLDPIKNHAMILATIASLIEKPIALVVVGDGPLRDELAARCNALGISERVFFVGSQSEPIPYICLMDIFLLPSFSEGTSMTLLEAMSCSKPCVVSDVGGNPEVVLNNATGLVVESGNTAQLREAILSLMHDGKTRLMYGQNGRRRFEELFEVGQMVTAYEQLYIGCLS